MSKTEFQTMGVRTGIITIGIVFSVLITLVIYDMPKPTEKMVEEMEMEEFKGDMNSMLEEMQNKCEKHGSPGNFESENMKSAWNECMNEANMRLEENFP